MKGKRDQLTYWLRGEEPKAAAVRAQYRAARRARGVRGAGELPPLPPADRRGQRSSLKNRNWKNQVGGLHR